MLSKFSLFLLLSAELLYGDNISNLTSSPTSLNGSNVSNLTSPTLSNSSIISNTQYCSVQYSNFRMAFTVDNDSVLWMITDAEMYNNFYHCVGIYISKDTELYMQSLLNNRPFYSAGKKLEIAPDGYIIDFSPRYLKRFDEIFYHDNIWKTRALIKTNAKDLDCFEVKHFEGTFWREFDMQLFEKMATKAQICPRKCLEFVPNTWKIETIIADTI